MKFAFFMAFLMMISGPTLSYSKQPSEDDIIRAFLNSPEIIQAQEEYKNNAEPKETKILFYESFCGVAGCQSAAIVAQKYQRKKVNPFIAHILGKVHIGTNGNIVHVERLILVPFKELKDSEDAAKIHK